MGFTQKASCAPWMPRRPSSSHLRVGGGGTDTDSTKQLNVYGETLQPCDTKGTGFTRIGACTFHPGDSGAHQVCLKNIDADFCAKTDQPDWCSSTDATNWCVCVHKFDQYKEKNGTGTIDCEATHVSALSSDWVVDECMKP